MKRAAVLFLVCLVCLSGPFAARADAADLLIRGIYDFALVDGTESLNLRTGPGTQYQWIGAAAEGSWVGVLGEDSGWYSVFLPETGQYGYMSKYYLKRADGTGVPGASTGVVSNPNPASYLNLRAAPSYSAQVLGVFYNGAAFTLLSSTADGWYQVQVGGMVGYFRHEYVRLNGASGVQTAYIHSGNGGKVNLRNAPTYLGSTVIGQYAPGTQVTVLLSSRVQASFWKVSVNGVTGYMDSLFLMSGASPVVPVNPGVQPATQGTAVVKNPKSNQRLNLRAQPSTSAKVIAQYKNGIRFEVIQAGETWTKVYGASSGNVGYFQTKYLTLSGTTFLKTVQNGNSYVNLRSNPSKASGTIYQRVPSGAAVTVLIPGDEWTKVRYNGTTGYMMTSFLK